MKKVLFIIISFILFVSCSTRENESHRVLNSFLNEQNYLNISDNDSVLIIHQSYPLETISTYSLNWDLRKPSKDYFPMYNFYWTDSTKAFILSHDEIAHLRNQLNNGEDFIIWKQNKVKRKNTLVVESDSIYLKTGKYNEYKIKKSLPVFNFTRPIFSKDYTICLFGFYSGLNFNLQTFSSHGYVIMKKEKNKWKFFGTMRGNEID